MPTSMSTKSEESACPWGFEDGARQVLNRVRRAFAGLVDAVAERERGGAALKATELQRELGLPSTLAWRVHRVARSETPFSEVESIPGSTAIQRVIEQGRKKGLPAALLTELRHSIEQFESLVRNHAGSRQTFNSMVTSMGEMSHDTIDLACRKEAFQVNSRIWGGQARTTIHSSIYYPGSHRQAMHQATIVGNADVKRLHANVEPQSHRVLVGHLTRTEEDRRRKRFGPVLMEEFSTHPLPIVNRTELDNGEVKLDLLPPTMGNNGATSYFFTQGVFDFVWSLDDPERQNAVTTTCCRTPTESFIIDKLVYRDMFGVIDPHTAIFDGRTECKSIQELFSRQRLPLKVEALCLGRGLDAMHSADLPQYPAMVERVCSQLGWDVSQFDVYRCRVEYPIMSSITAIWFPLPDKGNW